MSLWVRIFIHISCHLFRINTQNITIQNYLKQHKEITLYSWWILHTRLLVNDIKMHRGSISRRHCDFFRPFCKLLDRHLLLSLPVITSTRWPSIIWIFFCLPILSACCFSCKDDSGSWTAICRIRFPLCLHVTNKSFIMEKSRYSQYCRSCVFPIIRLSVLPKRSYAFGTLVRFLLWRWRDVRRIVIKIAVPFE